MTDDSELSVDPGSVKSDDDPADSSSDESSDSAIDAPRPATDDGLGNVPDVSVDVPVTSEAKADHDSQPNTEPDAGPAHSPIAAPQIHKTMETSGLGEASELRSDAATELDSSTPQIHNTTETSGLGGDTPSSLRSA